MFEQINCEHLQSSRVLKVAAHGLRLFAFILLLATIEGTLHGIFPQSPICESGHVFNSHQVVAVNMCVNAQGTSQRLACTLRGVDCYPCGV